MFDIDEHPNVDTAIDLAHRNDVRIAVSNPCLELWFLLHFGDQTAWIHRHEAQRRAAHCLGCGKSLSAAALDELHDRYDEARLRARQLDVKHRHDGSDPRANPSSEIWRLVDTINRAGG